jgi:hypothetical protein
LAIDFVHHYQGRSALIYQELQERTDALVEKAAIQLAAAVGPSTTGYSEAGSGL